MDENEIMDMNPESDNNVPDENSSVEDYSSEVIDESVKEDANEVFEEIIPDDNKKKPKKLYKVFIVLIALILVALVSLYIVFGTDVYFKLGLDKKEQGSIPDVVHNSITDIKKWDLNKYNNPRYINHNGRTVQDVANSLELTLDEFLTVYSLPSDMPADTEEMSAYYLMPVKVIAEAYENDFETLKEEIGIPDETTPTTPRTISEKIDSYLGKTKVQKIDENTPWGIVEDELSLGKYIGEKNLQTFKEFYGLSDDVNGETKYKEIRHKVDEKTAQLIAEEKAKKKN